MDNSVDKKSERINIRQFLWTFIMLMLISIHELITLSTGCFYEKMGFLNDVQPVIHSYPQVIHIMWIVLCKTVDNTVDN